MGVLTALSRSLRKQDLINIVRPWLRRNNHAIPASADHRLGGLAQYTVECADPWTVQLLR